VARSVSARCVVAGLVRRGLLWCDVTWFGMAWQVGLGTAGWASEGYGPVRQVRHGLVRCVWVGKLRCGRLGMVGILVG